MNRFVYGLLALYAATLPCRTTLALESSVITNAHDLAYAVDSACDDSVQFDIRAICNRFQDHLLFFEDESGAMFVNWGGGANDSPTDLRPGDRLRLIGRARRLENRIRTFCSGVEVLGHGDLPEVHAVTGRAFVDGSCDYRLVSVTGEVDEIIPDEIDSHTRFLSLNCDNKRILTPLRASESAPSVGSVVRASGFCMPAPLMSRRLLGRLLNRDPGGTPIEVLSPPRKSPFDVPDLKEFYPLQPEDIFRLSRKKTTGLVIALWNETRALVTTQKGVRIKVSFSTERLPAIGQTVEIAGLPETDLFGINLAKAIWREHSPDLPYVEDKPDDVAVGDIVRNPNGTAVFNSDYDRTCIRIKGVVRQLPSALGLDPRLYLDCDSRLVPIDLTAAPNAAMPLSVGSIVSVTGICLLEMKAWQPNLAIPKITGFSLTIRRNADIQVLSRPPFWTTGRLIGVIAVLAAVLLLILIWNRSLHILATHRGHQLFREKVAHYEASLRVDERTKLAVELHDSLAQSLSGAFMELETAESLGSGANPDMLKHLQIAAATVKSCHGELRNCLWDLRNLSLDEPNLETAIRKTLAPHVRGTDVAVRFNVPRARLSDNTAHAILRIIRELVLNAVRHGKATGVQIAGCIDNGKLLFSVRDNGCGFDPDGCPGVLQGHFGLEGIRERAGLLAGSLELESAPGKGTKASVSIVLPTADTKEQA